MSSLQKVSNGWRVHICVDGYRRSRTFKTKQQAQAWAENFIASCKRFGIKQSTITLREVLDEYANKVTYLKRGCKEELRRINALKNDLSISEIPISQITPEDIENWLRRRIGAISPFTGRPVKSSTIARYYTLLKAVFNRAIAWKYIDASPCDVVMCPVKEDYRQRVATEDEIERLKIAAQWSEDEVPILNCQRIIAAFVFACFTGMRIGEITDMEESWIEGNTIHIPREATKTYHGRTIAVPKRALKILNVVLKANIRPKIFGLKTFQHDATFRRIRRNAGLDAIYDSEGNLVKEGLNFHDSRATFCTWAASPARDGAPRLELLALARQLGHRNLKNLLRYYRKDPVDMIDRLNK